jgi:gamma-glutamyltranspeptidase/glutathione hydrolase
VGSSVSVSASSTSVIFPPFAWRPLARRSLASVLAFSLATSGCSTIKSVDNTLFGPSANTPTAIPGFIGGVAADEPQAALAARQVLAAGGNAADAAVTLGMVLAVTLPSRASLGSGGGCLAFRAGTAPGTAAAVLFPAAAPASAAGSDRPAAVPMLARGLYLLHARYGTGQFEPLMLPAEELARSGASASRALVRDLAVVAGPLGQDPGARSAFFRDGRPLSEGTVFRQPELAGTLGQLRSAGVGDLYQGNLARRLIQAASQVGGSFTLADLHAALPRTAPALTLPGSHGDEVAFLPPPNDGGLATAVAFQTLSANPTALADARARSLAAAARWRQGGATAQAILAGTAATAGSLPQLPASTSFATLDRKGNAVVCVLTMNNLFGTGRVAPGTGILLAASPNWMPAPLLAAAITSNPREQDFRAAVGASGQEAAPLAAAIGLVQAEAGQPPMPAAAPDPGRANIISCSGYMPDAPKTCRWVTDPRGAGLAVGSD